MRESAQIRHGGNDAAGLSGAQVRPYDLRWGTPEQVKTQFGINAAVLKAAWKRGWVRARQGNWESDDKRTQTVYCFEDLHKYLERTAHRVTRAYADRWWTDATVIALEKKISCGSYAPEQKYSGDSDGRKFFFCFIETKKEDT